MKKVSLLICLGIFIIQAAISMALELPISEATSECIDCHISVHPGIVMGWQNSRHAKISPQNAIKRSLISPSEKAVKTIDDKKNKIDASRAPNTIPLAISSTILLRKRIIVLRIIKTQKPR